MCFGTNCQVTLLTWRGAEFGKELTADDPFLTRFLRIWNQFTRLQLISFRVEQTIYNDWSLEICYFNRSRIIIFTYDVVFYQQTILLLRF